MGQSIDSLKHDNERRSRTGSALLVIARRNEVSFGGSIVQFGVVKFGVVQFGVTLFVALISFLGIAGCAGYQFGSRSLYRPDIQTVYVPIVRNETFRHDLGPRLTEAIVRRLQERTPYKVVGVPTADSTLTCRIVTEGKRSLTETITDEVRALDMVVSVEAAWVSRGSQVLMENRVLPTGNLALTFMQDARVVPEAGQSLEIEIQDAIDNLADRIVGQMEMRW